MSNNIFGAVGRKHSADLQQANTLGANLETTQQAFKDAVASGDQGQIAAAKMEFDKAQEALMGFMSATDASHNLVMQISQMLNA